MSEEEMKDYYKYLAGKLNEISEDTIQRLGPRKFTGESIQNCYLQYGLYLIHSTIVWSNLFK